ANFAELRRRRVGRASSGLLPRRSGKTSVRSSQAELAEDLVPARGLALGGFTLRSHDPRHLVFAERLGIRRLPLHAREPLSGLFFAQSIDTFLQCVLHGHRPIVLYLKGSPGSGLTRCASFI